AVHLGGRDPLGHVRAGSAATDGGAGAAAAVRLPLDGIGRGLHRRLADGVDPARGRAGEDRAGAGAKRAPGGGGAGSGGAFAGLQQLFDAAAGRAVGGYLDAGGHGGAQRVPELAGVRAATAGRADDSAALAGNGARRAARAGGAGGRPAVAGGGAAHGGAMERFAVPAGGGRDQPQHAAVSAVGVGGVRGAAAGGADADRAGRLGAVPGGMAGIQLVGRREAGLKGETATLAM